jgi:chemosensory pili system protein ChpC
VNRKTRSQAHVHALLVPLRQASLLIPTALVAEVVNVDALLPVPRSAEWVLGLLNWRARPVPVISFDALLGHGVHGANPRSKMVIFYPLAGRHAWDFFAVVSSGEPQPRAFTEQEGATLKSAVAANPSPYLSATLMLDGRASGIPDLEALNRLFYPASSVVSAPSRG